VTNAFRITRLVKRFPGFQLGPLDLSLEPGRIMGYIGANGAGKTTTMHCLVGLLRMDEGTVEVFGRPNDLNRPAWKLDVGYVGDQHVFYERWTAAENLKFLSGFYPGWSEEKVRDLARRLQLPLDKRARDLSTGNRVKLSLVAALAHSPKLLLLDEPTAGLDPVIRLEVLDELLEVIQDEERAIFYSTHILADIKRLVDELVFLTEGRIVLRTTKEALTESWRRITFRSDADGIAVAAAVSHRREGREHQVVSSDHAVTLGQLQAVGAEICAVQPMALEEIAVEIIKGGAACGG
jgi:ABC-2 type transport system ATP-binding protein